MKPIYLKIISLFFALSITAYSLFAFRGNYTIRYSIVVENIPQNVILKQENLDVVLEIDCPQILYSALQENKNKTISIKFEKSVRVVPDIVGNVPDGYIVSVSVYPQYVNISGPEDELKGRDRIFTDMIDIQGRTSDFSIEVPIYKTGNIKVYPQTATVFVSIKKVN